MTEDIYIEPPHWPSRWAYADEEQPVIDVNPDPMTVPSDSIVFMDVPADASDDEILVMLRTMFECRERGVESITCAIGGYDKDSRELWEIPEVKKLCDRLWRTGFIGLLDPSTRLEAAARGEVAQTFGALEIWQLAEGTFKPRQTLDSDKVRQFLTETWPSACEAAEVTLARQSHEVKDGDGNSTKAQDQEAGPEARTPAADGTAVDPGDRQAGGSVPRGEGRADEAQRGGGRRG